MPDPQQPLPALPAPAKAAADYARLDAAAGLLREVRSERPDLINLSLIHEIERAAEHLWNEALRAS